MHVPIKTDFGTIIVNRPWFMDLTWIKRPTVPGFYWVRGSEGKSKIPIAIAHVGERVVWNDAKKKNISQGWWAQLTPGGVALPIDQFTGNEFLGPIKPPEEGGNP